MRRRRGATAAEVVLATSESRTGLGCARSLCAAGIPFVAVSQGRGLLEASRAVRHHMTGPDPEHDPDLFVNHVLDVGARLGASVVLPTYDRALRVLDDRRDDLRGAGMLLAAAPSAALRSALDKRANLALARSLGIPCPRQFDLRDASQLQELIDVVGFPMVLKPAAAGSGAHAPDGGFKWLVASDERGLRELLERHCADGPFPLFQERLRGDVVGIYCLARRGEVVAMLAQRAFRRMFGENVYREIIPVPADLAAHAESLLASLSWDGLASLAFFVDRDGRATYLETNARPWGVIAGHVATGWDFPLWAVRYHRDGVVPSPPPPAIGSRACWRFADLMGVLTVARGEAWRTDRDDVRLRRAVWGYVAAFGPGVRSDVFRWNDPLPELVEHWQWLRATRLFRRR